MICHLCLTETEFCLPLKNAENQEKDEETEDIPEILKKYFDLELDVNSDLVCTVCWQQISEFHTFYLFIEEKQNEFYQESPLSGFTVNGNDANRDCNRYRLQICRLCSTETEFCLKLKNTKNKEKDEETEDIPEIIKKHFDLELDINSDLVCNVCWQQISEFHTFYLFIEEKQKEFNEQSSLPTFNGTRNDLTDNEYEVVMEEEVTAKHGNGVQIKNECLMDLNTPTVAENSLSQGSKQAALQESTRNLDTKKEFIDVVDIEAPSCEPCAALTETHAEYEKCMTDEDCDDEVDMKNEFLIEISSPMITENSFRSWTQKVTSIATGNLENIIKIEPANYDTKTNDFAETSCTQQTKITPTERKKQDWDLEKIGREKRGRRQDLRCESCDIAFFYRDSYDSHLLQVHPEGENSKFEVHSEAASLTIQCSLCPAKFSQQSLWLRHQRTHGTEKKFKCDECNKEFTTPEYLKKHKKLFHLRILQKECSLCPAKCSQGSLCLYGQQRIHRTERKVKCDECNKEYTTLKRVKEHKKLFHLRAYKKECDICGKSFVNTASWKRHKATIHFLQQVLEN